MHRWSPGQAGLADSYITIVHESLTLHITGQAGLADSYITIVHESLTLHITGQAGLAACITGVPLALQLSISLHYNCALHYITSVVQAGLAASYITIVYLRPPRPICIENALKEAHELICGSCYQDPRGQVVSPHIKTSQWYKTWDWNSIQIIFRKHSFTYQLLVESHKPIWDQYLKCIYGTPEIIHWKRICQAEKWSDRSQ